MKKVIFGITSLTIGGAERVLVDLANKLQENYEITIFTLYDDGELKKELNSNVKLISLYREKYNDLSKVEKIKASLKLIFYKRKIYNIIMKNGYDVEVAFLEGPITRLFSVKSNNRKIAWVHNDISKVYGNGIKAKIKKVIDGNIYKKYDKIIFVSKENQKDFNIQYNWTNKNNQEVIRNYIDYRKVLEKANEKVELPYDHKNINLLSVCRLVEQKAIDRLIMVHKQLETEGIHAKIYIIGDGPLRYSLQKLVDSLELTEDFILLGQKENPYPYIKECDYFCLLSYYEGYGMVLEEAKILNKPIIITDTAARECAKEYDKSIIVENTKEGIFKGLKNELKSDGINNLKNIQDEEKNKRNEEAILRKIRNNLS